MKSLFETIYILASAKPREDQPQLISKSDDSAFKTKRWLISVSLVLARDIAVWKAPLKATRLSSVRRDGRETQNGYEEVRESVNREMNFFSPDQLALARCGWGNVFFLFISTIFL